jgi:hypothetical protein
VDVRTDTTPAQGGLTPQLIYRSPSSPAGVCAHCGGGPRRDDPFVLLFVGGDRGDVHSTCHSTWLAAREAEARRALQLDDEELAKEEV